MARAAGLLGDRAFESVRGGVAGARAQLGRVKHAVRSHLLDIGAPRDVMFVAGMGRSGTTWVADLINHDRSYRVLFEPFHPEQVEAARPFAIMQYMSPEAVSPALERAAGGILEGKAQSQWMDRNNTGIRYRRRIVKDIRCNLMLGWLRGLVGDPPVVLIMRHPLQIASSWARLGWGRYASVGRDDLDLIVSQEALLDDFPVVEDALRRIQPRSFLEKVVFHWCVYQLVPLAHLKWREGHIVFYENLVLTPRDELVQLFAYLGKSVDELDLGTALRTPSSTNFLARDYDLDKRELVNSWKRTFSSAEIRRADAILDEFELSEVYDADGLPATLPHFARENRAQPEPDTTTPRSVSRR